MDEVLAYIDRNRARFVDELCAWARVPAISALPEHEADVARSAELLADEMQRLGGEDVAVLPTAGHPAVFARWNHAPDKPTLLVYGHHDVQPVDPWSAWQSPPFEPTIRDGRLYGRGVVDDKGQVWIHLKAVEAFLHGGRGRLPINLALLVEGEEEIGSVHLDALLRANAERLRADYVCISDTAMFGRGIPSLCVGLRGIAHFEIRVAGPAFDVHSGSFGGAIGNPANALARILASMHDADGRVAIEGFYDRVRTLSAREHEELGALPHDDAAWLAMSGAPEAVGEPGYGTLERLWTRPSLDVHGLEGGFQGEGAKTIIPASASAKLSCRLVPDQEPDEIARLLEAHVHRVAPKGVRVEVTYHAPGGRPYLADTDHPVFEVARRAFLRAFGKPTVFMREGGSIPFVRTIADALGKPCLLMGFGQPDENSHAPNEWLDLENFHLGIKSAAWLYEELARM